MIIATGPFPAMTGRPLEFHLVLTETHNSSNPSHDHEGHLVWGLLVGWLLNVVHLGIAYLLFVYGEQTLPTVFVLVGAIGLLQIGYIVPIWFVLRQRGKRRMAKGLLIAALITALINAGFIAMIYFNS
ncbi:MAG TPA: hypothetical protein VJA94_06950 [Candidatus Angelobacter sp.]